MLSRNSTVVHNVFLELSGIVTWLSSNGVDARQFVADVLLVLRKRGRILDDRRWRPT
jgi:hypothetical protein